MEITANDIVNVERLELHIMTDEDGETTTASSGPIASKQSIPRENRVRRLLSQFRLLYARHFNIVLVEKDGELTLRRVNPINVDL